MALTKRQITAKRARAKKLSGEISEHASKSAEREALWRELHAAEVEVKTLADDSGLTPMAVRKVLNRPAR